MVAVIVNHLSSKVLPSGYLGVDIFFVISGYVITSSLAGGHEGTLSDFLMAFYTRRIKRLVPALVLFVVVTAILTSFFDPEPKVSLRTGMTSLFGLSNLYLLQQSTNYFAASTDLITFAHTWSLGVEEQFYLFFPLLVWLTGFGRRTDRGAGLLFWTIAILSTASLAGFVLAYERHQPAAYFLMPNRLWELGAGCLLFVGPLIPGRPSRFRGHAPPLVLAGAIVAVLFAPRALAIQATIVVVALTTMLIASLHPETVAYRLFTRPEVTYVGLISYSLYLWHWSVLSLSRWTVGIHWWSAPIQVALMVGLAAASYRYLETPLRHCQWSAIRGRSMVYGVGSSLAAVGLLACVDFGGVHRALYLGSLPPVSKVPCMQAEAGSVWIVGDSHARAFAQVVDAATSGGCQSRIDIPESGTQFLFDHEVIGTRSGGQLVRAVRLRDPSAFIARARAAKPRAIIVNIYFMGFFSPASLALKTYDWVVVQHFDTEGREVSWSEALDGFMQSLRRVAEQTADHTRIVVVLPEPEFNWVNRGGASDFECQPQWFNRGRGIPSACAGYQIPAYISLAEMQRRRSEVVARLANLQATTSNVLLYDPLPLLCDEKQCSTHTPEGLRLFKDDDHIGDGAVKLLAPDFAAFLTRHGFLGPPSAVLNQSRGGVAR